MRKFFNKERSYWTDRIEYKGAAGTEVVYYKNGRPALKRLFDEQGLLQTIHYLGRNGAPLRMDSLVYAGEELIGAYYFSEPDHRLTLRFLSYQQQGQLSQRTWFGDGNELLAREFFLFDRNGLRRMRMIFDENDSLLFSERFQHGSDELELQNTYSISGQLVRQTVYDPGRSPYEYVFNRSGKISKISALYPDGKPIWTSDLIYNSNHFIERSNFSIENRFLFTHLGDVELFEQSLRSWRHPASPGQIERIVKFNHRDPFVEEVSSTTDGLKRVEYRLPRSGAVFKRSTFNKDNQPLADSLFSSRGSLQPVAVRTFTDDGLIDREITHNQFGEPRWLHTWFRDDQSRVIREELSALPDTFTAAINRFYDAFGQPAFSERFASPDSFDGTWVFYHGGGINQTLFYNDQSEITDSWLIRPGGDTVRHSLYKSIDYFRVESKLGLYDTLHSQLRFTNDGLLNWELFFDAQGRLTQEVHRKKDGSIYREVSYDHTERRIESSTYAPVGLSENTSGQLIRGEQTSRLTTRINAQGETTQIISYNSSGETAWEKRHAFRGGKLLKSAQLDADGKPVFISTYTHNEKGQVLTETALDRDGELIHSTENQYNELDQLIWRSFSSNAKATTSANRYYYDDLGRLQRDEIIEAKRFIEAVEYEYYPEYFLRLATHYTPEGDILRKEVENYFSGNVFAAIAP